MKHPVKQIPTESTIAEYLLAVAHMEGPWMPYFNFMARPVSYDILYKDPFFQWLGQHYSFIAGVLKMEPYQQYDWHVDTRRGVGINMLLEHGNSLLMFTEHPNDLVKNIYPVAYEQNRYYIFDTQTPHCVINLDSPRYLFTVEFEKDLNELSFDDLRKHIREDYKGAPDGESE